MSWLNLEYLYEKIYQFAISDESVILMTLKIIGIVLWVLFLVAMPVLLFAVIYLARRLNVLRVAEKTPVEDPFLVPKPPKVIKNPRWEAVLRRLNAASESEWKLAVIEADAMLDELIRDIYPQAGENLGERLKNIESSDLTNLQAAWDAHKIRNQIAHDPSFQLTAREARIAIENYRKVFEGFKFI